MRTNRFAPSACELDWQACAWHALQCMRQKGGAGMRAAQCTHRHVCHLHALKTVCETRTTKAQRKAAYAPSLRNSDALSRRSADSDWSTAAAIRKLHTGVRVCGPCMSRRGTSTLVYRDFRDACRSVCCSRACGKMLPHTAIEDRLRTTCPARPHVSAFQRCTERQSPKCQAGLAHQLEHHSVPVKAKHRSLPQHLRACQRC